MAMRKVPIFSLIILLILPLALANESKDEVEESNKVEDDQKSEGTKGEEVDLSHGFGTQIDWVAWPEAISIALDLDKPIFLLIHKTWCGACQQLKKSFVTSVKRKDLIELSKQFVMVNTEDDEEPEDDEYAPDGKYIPRLYFLNKYGERMPIDNSKNYPSNIAYFPQLPDVLKGMKQALKAYGVETPSEGEKKSAKESEKKTKKEATVDSKKEDKAEKKSEGKTAKKEETKSEAKEKKGKASKQESAKDEKNNKEKPSENKDKIDEASAGKGGCPHAAGKAAAKAKEAEEEAKVKEGDNVEKKETEKKTEKVKEPKKDAKKAEQTKEKKAKDTKKDETKKKQEKTKTEL